MIIEMIIKVIRSPKKAFEEEIGNLTFFLFMFLNGAILYLYSIAFVKFGLKSIEKAFRIFLVVWEILSPVLLLLQNSCTSLFLYHFSPC